MLQGAGNKKRPPEMNPAALVGGGWWWFRLIVKECKRIGALLLPVRRFGMFSELINPNQ
jgi:hypothetical protein